MPRVKGFSETGLPTSWSVLVCYVIPMQQNVPIGQIVELLLTWAIIGAVFVTIVFALSRYTMEIVGRSLLVIVLFIAALFYVFFAIRAGAGPF
jgi:hypothetical protein